MSSYDIIKKLLLQERIPKEIINRGLNKSYINSRYSSIITYTDFAEAIFSRRVISWYDTGLFTSFKTIYNKYEGDNRTITFKPIIKYNKGLL